MAKHYIVILILGLAIYTSFNGQAQQEECDNSPVEAVRNGDFELGYLPGPQISVNGCTWYSPSGDEISNSCQFELVPEVSGDYTVETFIESDFGICEASSSTRLSLIETIVVPDGFTPNGDGINDTWLIAGIENYEGASVNVYNRWGNLVYSQINQNGGYLEKPWDGSELPPGIYFYTINPNISEEDAQSFGEINVNPISGTVTLMK